MAPVPSVRSARDLTSFSLDADLIVVGTGAGGAMVAREAAQGGLKVIALEEGAHSGPRDFTQREDEMIPLLFQDAGGRTTVDGAVTVLQGRGVGGSTVHNTNLCKRAPDEVLTSWNLPGWGVADLAPHYEIVERDLSVTALTDGDLNRNNALLKAACQKLGWRGALLHHNRRGCQRSGFCELGCAYDAKENALKVLIPAAVASGADVIADCRAVRVLHDGKRVSGVEARVVLPDGKLGATVTLRGAVCLSGSAVGSAQLALKSALPDPSSSVGHGLRLHPGAAIAGVFADPVVGWQGVPQSYECTEKLRFDESPDNVDRSWILPVFAHPVGFGSSLPGFGAAHMAQMRNYARVAIFSAMLHDRTSGKVTVSGERVKVHYRLEPSDEKALLHGMRACAELMMAAGAQKVMVPFSQPIELTQPSQLDQILAHGYRPLDPLLTAVHPMGTLALGRVVELDGSWKGLERLWVADGSLFPTSLGGPPQLSIYAAAHKVAQHVVKALKS